MNNDRVWTAAEMELLSPDERAQIVADGFLDSLDELDPTFRARIEKKSQQVVAKHGLLNPKSS